MWGGEEDDSYEGYPFVEKEEDAITTITITAAKYSLLDEWDGNMATNGTNGGHGGDGRKRQDVVVIQCSHAEERLPAAAASSTMTGRTKETNDGRQLYWRLWCGDGNIILVVVTTLLEGRYSSSTTITLEQRVNAAGSGGKESNVNHREIVDSPPKLPTTHGENEDDPDRQFLLPMFRSVPSRYQYCVLLSSASIGEWCRQGYSGEMSALFGHVYQGGDPGWTWSGCSFASVGRGRKRRRRIITTTLIVTTLSTYREEYNNMSMLTLQTRLAYSARQVWD